MNPILAITKPNNSMCWMKAGPTTLAGKSQENPEYKSVLAQQALTIESCQTRIHTMCFQADRARTNNHKFPFLASSNLLLESDVGPENHCVLELALHLCSVIPTVMIRRDMSVMCSRLQACGNI